LTVLEQTYQNCRLTQVLQLVDKHISQIVHTLFFNKMGMYCMFNCNQNGI